MLRRARASQRNVTPLQSFYFADILIYAEEKCAVLKKNKLIWQILFLRIGTRAEVCSSSTSYSSLFTCVSRYWMRKVRSSQENTRFCFAAGSCWTEKISRTNLCHGCRMKLGTTSRNSTSCPDFTDSFLLSSSSRESGSIGAYNVTSLFRHVISTFQLFLMDHFRNPYLLPVFVFKLHVTVLIKPRKKSVHLIWFDIFK